jgi:hypothetical protein
MNAINESELVLVVRGKALKTMHIDQTRKASSESPSSSTAKRKNWSW